MVCSVRHCGRNRLAGSGVPSGHFVVFGRAPALKRRAIFGGPYGTGTFQGIAIPDRRGMELSPISR